MADHSRDNTYSQILETGSEHLVTNGKFYNDFPKVVILDEFKKQIPKSTACLSKYNYVVHEVSQHSLPYVNNIALYPRKPG